MAKEGDTEGLDCLSGAGQNRPTFSNILGSFNPTNSITFMTLPVHRSYRKRQEAVICEVQGGRVGTSWRWRVPQNLVRLEMFHVCTVPHGQPVTLAVLNGTDQDIENRGVILTSLSLIGLFLSILSIALSSLLFPSNFTEKGGERLK